MAEEACGFKWSERYKISKLGSCLRGEAEEFFNGLRDEWWEIEPTFEYVMEEMESAFSRTFSSAQVSEFFWGKKGTNVTWHAHYLYLMAVKNARVSPRQWYQRAWCCMRPQTFDRCLSVRQDKSRLRCTCARDRAMGADIRRCGKETSTSYANGSSNELHGYNGMSSVWSSCIYRTVLY